MERTILLFEGIYMETKKKRLGDRPDGVWLRDEDSLHGIMPYIYPNRADNEAFIQERIDLGPVNAYVDKKNKELEEKVNRGELDKAALEDPYKMFQIILAALVKTMTLRPKLNRFIAGKKLFQRDILSVGFVVKKKFSDHGGEALAYKAFPEDCTLEYVHNEIVKEINFCRSEENVDNSTDFMNKFMKLPAWLLRFVFCIIRRLDYNGKMPKALIKTDPDYASCFITNLGSIGLRSGYHHLSNWGTTSFFVILGEKKWMPVFERDGSYEMHEVMDIGLTIDERIADGFYYAKSVKLFKHLLAHPELLELPANEPVEY